jgi:hypothetical protein
MVNKIPEHLDNPIDNILYKIVDSQLPFYKDLNLTPNMLTTISLIFGLSSVYFLKSDKYILSSICYFLAYFYDCADGKMARKYNMTSKYGDLYDHVSDLIKHILLFYVLYYKLKDDRHFYKLIIFFIIILILSAPQVGCQEKTYNTNESPTLKITDYFIIDDCKKQMKYTRYFGPGTITLSTILIILYPKFR